MELVPTFGHLAEWALKRGLLHHDTYHAVMEWVRHEGLRQPRQAKAVQPA